MHRRKEFAQYAVPPREPADDANEGFLDEMMLREHTLVLRSYQLFVRNFMNPRTMHKRLLLKYFTGMGKTLASLMIAFEYIRLMRAQFRLDPDSPLVPSVWIIGFSKPIFQRELLSRTELGFITYEETQEWKRLRHIATVGSPADRDTLTDFESRLKKRLTKREYGGFFRFYGYKEFFNRLFIGAESVTDEDQLIAGIREGKVQVNYDLAIRFHNSIIICDEIQYVYNSEEMNNYGLALRVIIYLHDHPEHFNEHVAPLPDNVREALKDSLLRVLYLSATPVTSSPTEIVDLANLVIPAPNENPTRRFQKSDFFTESRALKPDALGRIARVFEGYISFVRDDNPVLFPRRVFEGQPLPIPKRYLKERLPEYTDTVVPYLSFHRCPMSPLHYKTYRAAYDGALPPDGQAIIDLVLPNPADPELGLFRTKEIRHALAQAPQKWRDEHRIELIRQDNLVLITGDFMRLENLREYSTKYARLVELVHDNLRRDGGKILISHPLVQTSGVLFIQEVLRRNGLIDEYASPTDDTLCSRCGEARKGHGDEHEYMPARFVTLHGEIDAGTLERSKDRFRMGENLRGHLYRVAIGSKVINVGIDFTAIREVMITHVPDSFSSLLQIIGRAIRSGSHMGLPQDEWEVRVHILVSSIPAHVRGGTCGCTASQSCPRCGRCPKCGAAEGGTCGCTASQSCPRCGRCPKCGAAEGGTCGCTASQSCPRCGRCPKCGAAEGGCAALGADEGGCGCVKARSCPRCGRCAGCQGSRVGGGCGCVKAQSCPACNKCPGCLGVTGGGCLCAKAKLCPRCGQCTRCVEGGGCLCALPRTCPKCGRCTGCTPRVFGGAAAAGASNEEFSYEEYRYFEKSQAYLVIQKIDQQMNAVAVDAHINRNIVMRDPDAARRPPELGTLYFEPLVEPPPPCTLTRCDLDTSIFDLHYGFEEVNTIVYVIKRLFTEQSYAYTYEDLWAAVRDPPFQLNVNPAAFAEDSFRIALELLTDPTPNAYYSIYKRGVSVSLAQRILDPEDLTIRGHKLTYCEPYYISLATISRSRPQTLGVNLARLSGVPDIDYEAWYRQSGAGYWISTDVTKRITAVSASYDQTKFRFYWQYRNTPVEKIPVSVEFYDLNFHARLIEDCIRYAFTVMTNSRVPFSELHEFYFRMLYFYDRLDLVLFADQLPEPMQEEYAPYILPPDPAYELHGERLKNIEADWRYNAFLMTTFTKAETPVFHMDRLNKYLGKRPKASFKSETSCDDIDLYVARGKTDKPRRVHSNILPVGHFLVPGEVSVPRLYKPDEWRMAAEFTKHYVPADEVENDIIVGFYEKNPNGLDIRFKLRSPKHKMVKHADLRLAERGTACSTKKKHELAAIAASLKIKTVDSLRETCSAIKLELMRREIHERRKYRHLPPQERRTYKRVRWFYLHFEPQ